MSWKSHGIVHDTIWKCNVLKDKTAKGKPYMKVFGPGTKSGASGECTFWECNDDPAVTSLCINTCNIDHATYSNHLWLTVYAPQFAINDTMECSILQMLVYDGDHFSVLKGALNFHAFVTEPM